MTTQDQPLVEREREAIVAELLNCASYVEDASTVGQQAGRGSELARLVKLKAPKLSTSRPETEAKLAAPADAAREPTMAEIHRAAWAWRNAKDRETDGADEAYFRNNWRSLPGLKSYVEAEIAKRPSFAEAAPNEELVGRLRATAAHLRSIAGPESDLPNTVADQLTEAADHLQATSSKLAEALADLKSEQETVESAERLVDQHWETITAFRATLAALDADRERFIQSRDLLLADAVNVAQAANYRLSVVMGALVDALSLTTAMLRSPFWKVAVDPVRSSVEEVNATLRTALQSARGEGEGRLRPSASVLGRFCHACQAIPSAGYCHLAGCPLSPANPEPGSAP